MKVHRDKVFVVLGIILIANTLWAGEIIQTVNFSPDDLIFTSVKDFDVVELKGYPSGTKLGEPRLPRVVQALLIPAGATPTEVELITEEIVGIAGTYKIVPTQKDVPLPMPGKVFVPKEVKPNPDVYSKDKSYPARRIRLIGAGTLSGYRIAHVEIFPLDYNPVKRKCDMATRITYKLKYVESRVPVYIPSQHQQENSGQEVRTLVANPQNVAKFAPRIGERTTVSILPPGNYQYVIISGAPSMDTVFERLADWKTKKGIPATVVQVSWINSNYSGYDLPEKIRNFIIDAYSNWQTMYVLLGGSADHKTTGQNLVPAREAFYTVSGAGYYNDEDTIPCDLYYADLDGTWDANHNYVWGEIGDNVDMYADIYVGRVPVYTVAQAQNFVHKVLTYEKNPPADYIKKMLLPTAILWDVYEERPMQDSIARMTPYGWSDAKLYERNGLLSNQRMIDSMNVGYGMGHWVGHGNENGIYYSGNPYLSSSDVPLLNNGDKVGIVNSIACFTGAWDETPGDDCFAEHLINRVGGGVAAVIMNSRYGFGAYVNGYVPGPSERLDTTFYAKIFNNGMHKCGVVHSAAKDAWVLYADSLNQYWFTRWCIYELNLLGDPELPLWTDVPKTLTVNFPGAIPLGNQNVNVTVTSSGSPVQNALVCLQKETETYASGYTNAGGAVTLNVTPLTPVGKMDITVTAKNHYPFEDTIIVLQPNRPFVLYLKSSISDPVPGGNNDGILNPGESVEMPLWVKNYGQVQANGVVGILRSTDTYPNLSDTIKNFGNIPTNDSAFTGANGYNLNIANNCPNGHPIVFTLVCKDNTDSTWSSQFCYTVYAPILTYQNKVVLGGNNNYCLDPGETANLVVTIKNEGGAVANNVTSTLIESSSYITINDAVGAFGSISQGDTATNYADPYTITASATTPIGTTVQFQIYVVSGVYVDTLEFNLIIGKKDYYIWNPDLAPTSGQIMHTILTNLGYNGVYGGAALAQELTMYQTVIVCAGVYPYKYIINSGSSEALRLANYLQNQNGRIYLEGGDVWYYDPVQQGGYNFGPLFGIIGLADGSGDMGPVIGQNGTFTSGMNFNYGGENILMDRITPNGSGFLIFQDGNNNYNCGVANISASDYRTVGVSFELGGLTDGSGVSRKAVLLDSIMHFFGCIVPGVDEAASTGAVPKKTELAMLYPNPGNRPINIRYQLASEAVVTLQLYDASGRVVRTMVTRKICQPGYYTVVWNGCDDDGRALASGVYFVYFEAGNYQQIAKAVLLR